jgi:hypothetical protein
MLRRIFAFVLLTMTITSHASPLQQSMTIKERLRLSLWSEGLENHSRQKPASRFKKVLPEEIERSLRKL